MDPSTLTDAIIIITALHRHCIVIKSGYRKERSGEREPGSQKDTERELLEEFVSLTHGDSIELCSREITERERESDCGREEARSSRWT